jgi:hypothetical protein
MSDDRLVRSTRPPTGLPILSTESLTAAERKALRDLRQRFVMASLQIADALDIGTVANGIATLQAIAEQSDGIALRTAAKLGGGR